jgi:hypothetical protein
MGTSGSNDTKKIPLTKGESGAASQQRIKLLIINDYKIDA